MKCREKWRLRENNVISSTAKRVMILVLMNWKLLVIKIVSVKIFNHRIDMVNVTDFLNCSIIFH